MKPLTKDKQKYFMAGEKVYLEKDIKDAVDGFVDDWVYSVCNGLGWNPMRKQKEHFPALYSEDLGNLKANEEHPYNCTCDECAEREPAKDECVHKWVDRIGEDNTVIATLCEKCGEEQTKEGVE
jgi:hypothetical protein